MNLLHRKIISFQFLYLGNSTNSDLCSWIEFTRSCSFIHFVGKQIEIYLKNMPKLETLKMSTDSENHIVFFIVSSSCNYEKSGFRLVDRSSEVGTSRAANKSNESFQNEL